MLYLIAIGAFILILGGGVWKAYDIGVDAGKADCEAAHEKADEELKIKANKYEQEAANHIADMEVAYDKGAEEYAAAHRTVQLQGAKNVEQHASVYRDPKCTIPSDGLLILNRARAGFRTAPDTTEVDATVRDTTASQGGDSGRSISTDDSGRRPRGKVR